MAATRELALMLDELMGPHRNALKSDAKKLLSFDDPEVCKHYLVDFCPSDLFTNTKADLGHCDRIHCEKLKEKYRTSSRFRKCGYEEAFLDYLLQLQADIVRKIRRNKERLELTQPGGKQIDSTKNRNDEKFRILSEKVAALHAQAEQLGAEGKVEEAQSVVKMAENLANELDQMTKELEQLPAIEMKLMEVCDTCGCFLIVGDSPHRLEEHLTGKQHVGYAKIKETIDMMQKSPNNRQRSGRRKYVNSNDSERRNRNSDTSEYGKHRSGSGLRYWRRSRSVSRGRHEWSALRNNNKDGIGRRRLNSGSRSRKESRCQEKSRHTREDQDLPMKKDRHAEQHLSGNFDPTVAASNGNHST
ncbi:Luc7-like protein 3 [Trichinella pseudospiralis]|uniref:Luc7-like protein 3 n=1 Tax=Trichinella pseudospiralis TaxID=6337 RepID=A0A0V1ITP9_TRIPS|nr:Luc7-like protein 3 [Trichinella pseudospiralis]KRZ26159.1 Luc7-like protein 3 [Trichinella pseudospiralis]